MTINLKSFMCLIGCSLCLGVSVKTVDKRLVTYKVNYLSYVWKVKLLGILLWNDKFPSNVRNHSFSWCLLIITFITFANPKYLSHHASVNSLLQIILLVKAHCISDSSKRMTITHHKTKGLLPFLPRTWDRCSGTYWIIVSNHNWNYTLEINNFLCASTQSSNDTQYTIKQW